MDLQRIQDQVGMIVRDKGFRDLPTTTGDRIALMHSELSEALEEIRAGHSEKDLYEVNGKPEGYLVELADVVIRVLDEFDRLGASAEDVIIYKLAYNSGRPYLHNKVM